MINDVLNCKHSEYLKICSLNLRYVRIMLTYIYISTEMSKINGKNGVP